MVLNFILIGFDLGFNELAQRYPLFFVIQKMIHGYYGMLSIS